MKNNIQKYNLKIYINFQIKDAAWGGGNSFLKILKNELITSNHYTKDITDSDVIIFNGHHHLIETLKLKVKFPNKLFIHRLDGPMNELRVNGALLDFLIKIFSYNVSDAIIFQSKWSMLESIKCGYSDRKKLTIIGNSCDSSIFNKSQKKIKQSSNKTKILFASWSNNSTKGLDMLFFLDKNLDFKRYEINVVGNIENDFTNINIIGQKNQHELSKELDKSDIFLFASYKEAYSNMLIEAVASGLPVITRKASSNVEIVLDERLLFSSGNDLLNKIEEVSKNINKDINYKYKIISTKEVAIKYINFSNDMLKNHQKKILKIHKIIFLYVAYYVIKFLIVIREYLK